MARPLRVVGRAAIAALSLHFGGAAPAQLRASPPPEAGFVAEDLARRTAACGATLLMVTAHPDDEDNALAALLRRRHGVRVVLWTMTRGEGGQNEIGDEQGEALALLRDAELEAAHRFDGIEQFPYDRDVPPFPDFGYSFSWAETMEKWAPARPGLGASRAVLQRVRPEVVLVMDPDWDGGGQHHQASAVLMLEECVLERNPWRDDGLAADGAPWHVPR
ncbi:MAG TPA: PIG-L family deacetylase, partial [Planctomycetota bacterium]|nr:PIG-L family deacetylase [Planctomycetota bacterium]